MDYLVSFLRKPSIGNAPARINGPVKIIVQLNFKFDDEVLGKPAVGKCLIFNMFKPYPDFFSQAKKVTAEDIVFFCIAG